MHDIDYKILSLFRKNPEKAFSTSRIAEFVFPDEFSDMENNLRFSSSRQELLRTRRVKAKLHRKLLHHLNRLVGEGILKIEKIGLKGQKFFSVNLEYGYEFEIRKSSRKIRISKTDKAMPIEGLEKEGVLYRYGLKTWINRVNSTLLECRSVKSLRDLKYISSEMLSTVNDCICLNSFNCFFTCETIKEIISALKSIDYEAETYGKTVSITLEMSDNPKIQKFIKEYLNSKLRNTKLILNISIKDLKLKKETIKKVLSKFVDHKEEILIKNKTAGKAPYFLGDAGPYTFCETDWLDYSASIKGKVSGIVCGQSTIIIDVYRFFEKYKSSKKFRVMIINSLKTLLYHNSKQRRETYNLFREIIDFNKPFLKEFFLFSNNYIRFWNYGLKQPNIDQAAVLEMIEDIKRAVDEFCAAEETVYKSCGIPTRFKVVFSCASNQENKLSPREFKRVVIEKRQDITKESTDRHLRNKERISEIFNGGDIARIYRRGNISAADLLKDLQILLTEYNLPFISFSLKRTGNGNLTLNHFMWRKEDGNN